MVHSEVREQMILEAASKFPAEFKLRAYPGDVFRINLSDSYANEVDGKVNVTLYIGVKRPNGRWPGFVKGSPEELAKEVITPPLPMQQNAVPRTITDFLDVLRAEWDRRKVAVDWTGLERLQVQILSSDLNVYYKIKLLQESIDAFTGRGHFTDYISLVGAR